MGGYSELIGMSSNALLSSMFWGISYFIVLLAPMYVYLNSFFSKEEKAKAGSFHEVIGYALVIQIGALLMFLVLGVFLTTINIGNSDLKPEKAFFIFFGSGNELLDVRWDNHLQSLAGDSAALTKFGNEAKGVAFLANKYIGVFYRIFILLIFFSMLFFILVNFTRKFNDAEGRASQDPNVFGRLYGTFATVVAFVLLVVMHSMIASTLPASFGIQFDAVAINFIPYFQQVVGSTFYK